MIIPPHTICPCQLIYCFLLSQQLHCIPLVHPLYTAHRPYHRSFCSSQSGYIFFSQTPRFASIYHSLSYTARIYLSFYLQREFFSKQYLTTLSEFLPSRSCSCSYCSFTSSTGVQLIAKIAKSLHSFHFITHYLLLHFSHHLSLYHICYKQKILPHLELLSST